jgi:NAD(P)H-dependent FMN reductase
MPDHPLHILAVAGSLNESSVTRFVVNHLADQLRAAGCPVDVLDLRQEALPLFDPELAYTQPGYPALAARVARADVFILGTPDYHGSVSSAMKNFLDHFWQEFTGKLFAPVVASHEKGLTVLDQLRTVARQCYAWAMPYGVSFAEKTDVANGVIVSESFQKRLDMFARDIRVYGSLLAQQRHADLAGSEPGFMARLRNK